MPPGGSGWRYIEQEQDNRYTLHFSKPGISPTHTISALFFEFHGNTDFSSPEHFLNYIREMKKADIDPWRHQIIDTKWVLDGRFGDYSVYYYIILKDYDPYRMDPREYSIVKTYGYAIVHPYFESIVIDILYTEQGKPAEVNPQLDKVASTFFEGLHLKKKEE